MQMGFNSEFKGLMSKKVHTTQKAQKLYWLLLSI